MRHRASTVASAAAAPCLLTPLLPAPALAQSQRTAPRPASRPTVSVPAFKNTVTQQTWWWSAPTSRRCSPSRSSANSESCARGPTPPRKASSQGVSLLPAAKALRAALIDASSYVSCLDTPTDGCMEAFEAQDRQRRERTRGVLQLD